MIRHARVYLAGEFDEAGVEVEFLCLPRKVKRINRNAVSAQSRAGIKRLKSEGLGGCGADHLENIYPHSQAKQLQFIDQGDVYATINILQQFGHFRSSWRRNRHYAIKNGVVQSTGVLRG